MFFRCGPTEFWSQLQGNKRRLKHLNRYLTTSKFSVGTEMYPERNVSVQHTEVLTQTHVMLLENPQSYLGTLWKLTTSENLAAF